MQWDETTDPDGLVDLVRRAPILATLQQESMEPREVERRLGISKSTRHRHVTWLEDRDLLIRENGEYTLTAFGRAVADVLATFTADMHTAVRLAPIYHAVAGTDPPCPIDVLADATVTTSDRGDPFAPLARFLSLVGTTESLRMADSYAIAPTYIDEIHGRVLDGLRTDVIERPEVAEDIMANYPRKCVQLCASEYLTMKIHDDLPFGLVILDDRIGIGVRDPETGVPRAFVDTDADAAREWAEALFESYSREGTELERFNPRALTAARTELSPDEMET